MSEITKALCLFHEKVATIHKLSQAQYGAYADLQTVLGAITPALCEAGLAVTHTLDGEVLVTTLRHRSGESIESRSPLIPGSGKNPLHSWGAAITYQRRYAVLAILSLAAGIEDDDGGAAVVVKVQKTSPPVSDGFF